MTKTKSLPTPSFPRLTEEEESELLRQAVEFRRLNQIESDLALQSPNNKIPLLPVRAKAAGYGEELDDYEDAKIDGQRAREALVTHNMGLVHHCVKQILGQSNSKRSSTPLNSLSKEDLIQEGAIGLARAVDKWNPAVGGRFSTYAVYWIRASVFRCIAERDDLLRVPNHVSQSIRNINKAAKRLGWNLDANGIIVSMETDAWKQAQAAKQLAEEAGLSERNFEEAMKARKRRYTGGYVTFETWMQKGENLNLESDVPVSSVSEEASLASLQTEHLRTTLSKFLRPKEMEALSWRYGLLEASTAASEETNEARAKRYLAEAEEELFGAKPAAKAQPELVKKGRFGEAMTFNEVGKKMQVSAEYGRRLCHKALSKLQQAAADGHLEPALLF